MKACLKPLLLSLAALAPVAAQANTCPRDVAVSSVSVDRSPVIGGTENFNLTLNFSTPVPQGCSHFYGLFFNPATAIAAGGGMPNIQRLGNGQSSLTTSRKGRGVDQPTTVIISAKGSNQATAATTTIQVLPPPLVGMTVSSTSVAAKSSVIGKVEIGGGSGGFEGTVTINLSASPAGLVKLPEFVSVGDEITALGNNRFTEHFRSFTITPVSTVVRPTQVTITATRLGVSFSRVITLQPPSPILVQPVTPPKPIIRP